MTFILLLLFLHVVNVYQEMILRLLPAIKSFLVMLFPHIMKSHAKVSQGQPEVNSPEMPCGYQIW